MKKTLKLTTLLLAFVLVVAATAMVGCQKAETVKMVDNFVVATSEEVSSGRNTTIYSLNIFSDGSYELTKTESVYGYDTVLSSQSTITRGTYTIGEKGEDGYVPISLSEATEITFSSFSKLGGYDMQHTLDSFTEENPTVKMPGGIVTDLETFKKLGAAVTYYISYDVNGNTRAELTLSK